MKLDGLDAILHDLAGETYNYYDTSCNRNIEETLIDDVKNLYQIILKNEILIYPGNITYTWMSCNPKLIEFKSASNYYDKAFNNLIKFIMDVLPKKQTLPKS